MSSGPAAVAAWIGCVGVCLAGRSLAQDGDPVADFDRSARTVASESDADGRSAAARRAVRAFLRLSPDDEARQLRLPQAAELAFVGGDFERCKRWSEEALALGASTEDAVRLRALGWRAILLGEGGDAALEACHADRGIVPSTVTEAFLVEAQSLERGALFEAAQRRLRVGVGDDAAFWALTTLADAVTRGPLETVQQRFGAALALGNLALAERQRGDVEAAEASYRRAVELYDADAILWNDYGMLLRVLGRDDEAVAALRRSIEVEGAPGDGPGLTNLGLMYRLRGGRGLPPGFGDVVALIARDAEAGGDVGVAVGPTGQLVEAYGVLLARRPGQTLVRRMLVDLIVPRRD